MTADRRSAGFTLIEIVLVLVLLGILGAVAAYKYFDMQDKAAEKKCAYHRSLVVDALQNRWALAVADVDRRSELFSSPDQAASQVLAELNGEACGESMPCNKLCSVGGKYTVKSYENCGSGGTHEFEDGYVFSVTCSKHPGETVTKPEGCKKDSGGSSDVADDNKITVTSEGANRLMEFMKEIYQKPLKSNENADVPTIDKYFTKADKDEIIHSDLKGRYNEWSYGTYNSVTAIINKALSWADINTEDVIWSLARTLGNREGTGKDEHWEAVLTLVVADREQVQAASVGSTVPAKVVVVKVIYKTYDSKQSEQVERFDSVSASDAWAKVLEETDQEGNKYRAVELVK